MTFLASAKAKVKMKKVLAKGQSKAKTAITSPSQQKIAAKIKQKIKDTQKTKAKLAAPGELARCRAFAGGDWRAAMLLYRIAYLWRVINPKMRLPGGDREYLAMSQADWETSSGLSTSELKNYALPILKERGFPIVQFEVHGRSEKKKTWVHFDEMAYRAALDEAGYELKVAAMEQ